MTEAKTDAVPVKKPEAEDPQRRNLAMALLGALGGAAFLEACGADGGPLDPQSLGQASEALTGTNVTWVDAIGTAPLTGTSLNLRGKVGSNSAAFAVALGYANRGDGGGGIFAWIPSPTALDDGGTIIVANQSLGSTTPGPYWKRIYAGPVDVKWFGAKGDGSSTPGDTTAIQNAVNAAQTVNGVVYFPPGTYFCTGISVTATVGFRGAGASSSVLKQQALAAAAVVIVSSPASFSAVDVGFDGNKAAQVSSATTHIIDFDGIGGGSFTLDGCKVFNNVYWSIWGARVNNIFRISKCEFRDAQLRAASLTPSQFLQIDSGVGTIDISENSFIQTTVTADNTAPAGIVLQGTLDPPPALGSTIGMSANVSENFFYGIGAKSIGNPLGCVDVYNWVGKLTIVGNRFDKPTYSAVKIANSSAVVISNNTVTDAAWQFGAAALFYSGAVPHPGIQNQPFMNTVIANNIVRNYPASGQQGSSNNMFAIHVAGTSGAWSLGHVISGNMIDNSQAGILLDGVGDVLVTGNVIRNCWGNTTYDGSIAINRAEQDILIVNCLFRDNKAYDILAQVLDSALHLTVSGCVFYQDSGPSIYSIYATGIHTAHVVGNRFQGTTRPLALNATVSNAYLYDNTAEQNVVSLAVTNLQVGSNSWTPTSASSRPTYGLVPGLLFFDTSLVPPRPIWRNTPNTGWVDSGGNSV